MQKISISEIQRNLHKLDEFDIVEIIDKKRNVVKGFYIQAKYADFVVEIAKKIDEHKKKTNIAGVLHRYANPELKEKEKNAWQNHIMKKYQKSYNDNN